MGHRGKKGDKLGVGTMTMIGIGTILGIGADFMWQSLGLPGRTNAIQGCPALNEGDVVQFAGAAFLTFIGFLTGSKALPAFTFGVATGLLIPKVFTPYLKMPRYVLFDYNQATGTVTPKARLNL